MTYYAFTLNDKHTVQLRYNVCFVFLSTVNDCHYRPSVLLV